MTPRKGFTVWVIYREILHKTMWLDKTRITWTATADLACEFMTRQDAIDHVKHFFSSEMLHQTFIAARHKTHLPEPDSIV